MEDISFKIENENNDNKINILDQTLQFDVKDIEQYFDKDTDEDESILLDILNNDIDKDIEKENKKISKLEKSIQFNNSFAIKKNYNALKLKFDEEALCEKLTGFLLSAYKIISEKNYDLIEEEDTNEISKEKKDLLNLINEILSETENNNCKITFILGEKENTIGDKEFQLNFYAFHKIMKFNDLLKIKIAFKIKIKMYIRSGNVYMSIPKCSINYNKEQKIIIKADFKCSLINNVLGNYGTTYCTCGDCMKCNNRKKPKPFDDLLDYLKTTNNIKNKKDFTGLWYGKYNKYRNESGYKCSFCKEFYQNKLNIVRLYCNHDIDPDHSCQFWICLFCYKKRRKNSDEVCPNCGKFLISFSKLRSFYRYYRWKTQQNL